MHYDDFFFRNVDQIMRYKVEQCWCRLGPNWQTHPKKVFLGKFKCKTYDTIVHHYPTQGFTNIPRVNQEIAIDLGQFDPNHPFAPW